MLLKIIWQCFSRKIKMFILFHPAITLPEIHAEEPIQKVTNYTQQDVQHIVYNKKKIF